ncbi:MAG: AI-2E family transporter, partial [Geminicoccales bacterium]
MDALSRIEQIAVIALLVILTVGCFLVLRPFLSALLWAMILAFSTWPLYARFLHALNGRKTLAASLMTLLVATVLVLPLLAVGSGLADSVAKVAGMVRTLLEQGPPGPPLWLREIPLLGGQIYAYWLDTAQLGAAWTAELQPYLETGRDWALTAGLSIGNAILELSLSLAIAFFFFRDGAEGARQLSAASERLAGARAKRLIAVAGGTIKGVVYG